MDRPFGRVWRRDVTRWIFLRHGESTANAAGVLSGWTDVPLTPTGEAQAIAAGRGLADVALHQVLTTDLQRARRTAELALAQWAATTGQPAPRLEVDGRLRERNMGRWRGKPYKKLRASGLTETMMAWDGRPPGGESNADLARRIVAALADYEEQVTAGPVLLVAHGGVIRTLLGLTDGVPRADIARQSIANAVPLTRDLAAGHWSTLFSLL